MVVNGDMQELPFGDEVFEDVISINAMYHVPRPEKVIEETVRVLKPGGKFGLDDWFTTSLTRPETVQRLRHNWSTPPNGFHSVSRTLSLLESQGLSIIDAEDFTQEAAAFLTEERFGKTFDSQVAPTLVTVFPHLYKYEGYRPEHALQAVSQLKSDALYMGELYRNREATYMEIMAQKDSVEVIYSHQS
jgi:SAM-dependent methyltransferase